MARRVGKFRTPAGPLSWRDTIFAAIVVVTVLVIVGWVALGTGT
jgi:hypothetical protein